MKCNQLRYCEEYTEYTRTLRRINARGNTNTEEYIEIWGNLLKKVHQKASELLQQNMIKNEKIEIKKIL